MHKMVNGIRVELTPEEELEITSEWEKNARERDEFLKLYGYISNRQAEYPTIEELIVGMWELLIEQRPEVANSLQVKRTEIKQKYPKPVSSK